MGAFSFQLNNVCITFFGKAYITDAIRGQNRIFENIKILYFKHTGLTLKRGITCQEHQLKAHEMADTVALSKDRLGYTLLGMRK